MPKWEPDYKQVVAEYYTLPSSLTKFTFSSGGFLLAVSVVAINELPMGTDNPYRAEYAITSYDDKELLGLFHWRYQLTGCGIAFKNPIINVNSQIPYVLKRNYPKEMPPVRVTVIHLLMKDR